MNALASVQRALQEPTPHSTDLELAQELLELADRFITSVLTIEAYLLDNPVHCALPMASDFCDKVDEAFQSLALAIGENQALTRFPDVENLVPQSFSFFCPCVHGMPHQRQGHPCS